MALDAVWVVARVSVSGLKIIFKTNDGTKTDWMGTHYDQQGN